MLFRSKNIQLITLHVTEDQLPVLKAGMENLKNINGSIWNSGDCALEIRLSFQDKETSIRLGENFRFQPNQDNIASIKDAFPDIDLRIN